MNAKVSEITLIMQQLFVPKDLIRLTSEICRSVLRDQEIHRIVAILEDKELDIPSWIANGVLSDIFPYDGYMSSQPLTQQQMTRYVIFEFIKQQSIEIVDIFAKCNFHVTRGWIYIDDTCRREENVTFRVNFTGVGKVDIAVLDQLLEDSNSNIVYATYNEREIEIEQYNPLFNITLIFCCGSRYSSQYSISY